MNRIIKFRAWDKKSRIMSVEVDLFHGLEEWERSRAEVMQFTGLTDKNGKEIYEGDIVRIKEHWASGWSNKPMEVKFDGGCFFPWGTGDWEEPSEEWEIIGNIYENPNLLT